MWLVGLYVFPLFNSNVQSACYCIIIMLTVLLECINLLVTMFSLTFSYTKLQGMLAKYHLSSNGNAIT